MDKKTIEKILEAAVKAPSGDNVQPWRFQVANEYTQINLYNLPELDDSYYNYQQTASYVAHGAVIENIAIAARYFGCQAEVELFPDAANPDHVASIDLLPASPEESDSLYDAIFKRCTNRFSYQPIELSKESIQKLSDAAEQVDGIQAYFAHERRDIEKLAKAVMVNDRLVFERQDMHRYLFDKVRWNKAQIETTQDGMPVETLGLNPLEKLFFPLMRFWWFVAAANYVGLSQVVGLKCWYNCRSASLLCEITAKKADKYGFVRAGRAMQRVWLEATRQGLACQPIIGLPLLINRLRQDALQEFSDKHRKMLEQAEKSLMELFHIDPSEALIVGLRIGKGRPLAITTPRKSVY